MRAHRATRAERLEFLVRPVQGEAVEAEVFRERARRREPRARRKGAVVDEPHEAVNQLLCTRSGEFAARKEYLKRDRFLPVGPFPRNENRDERLDELTRDERNNRE